MLDTVTFDLWNTLISNKPQDYIKYGLTQANYFLTGPTIVDSSNVEQVAKLVEAGYR